MDVVKAVELAKKGDDAGFTYLYEKTYQSKYYLALKYVKDEETAKDVLQEAYLKAFSKIDTLECSDKFSAWLGMIVANTAQNALKKKNPTLFADVAPGYEVELEIEDENSFNRPESACTQKETVELVHELLGTLSDAQRICVLMYHIEGYSISEIAETLGCSENTVKSRLLYGRKAIKTKAEELQKKGHQLYVVAPGAILIYFLTREEEFLAADGTLDVVKNSMPNPAEANASVTDASGAAETVKTVGAEAVKKGFFTTVVGKVTVGIVALCVVGAVAAGAMNLGENEEHTAGGADTETEETQETQETETQEPQSFELTDDMYSQLLAGSITKEQLEFIIAYGPTEVTAGEYNARDLQYIIMLWKEQYSLGRDSYVTCSGYTSDYAYYAYDLKEVNTFLSVLGMELTEAHNSQMGTYTAKVDGDKFCISTSIPDATFASEANILSARVDGDVMTIEYDVEFSMIVDGEYESPSMYNLVATLEKGADGLFRVVTISARN